MDKIDITMMTTIMVLIVILVVYSIATAITHRECLEAGYHESTITYNFDSYCITLDSDATVKLKLM